MASTLLNKIPLSADLPIPITTAIGEASPSAQGQAIIRTDTAYNNALSNCAPINKYQIIKVINEIMTTVGTNIAETLSANL